jgi:fatty acid-binding protein DegV
LSGRINALQNIIVAALKVKPIITLRSGLLEISDKVRTRQRALDLLMHRLHEAIGTHRIYLAVVHAAAPQAARSFYDCLCREMNVIEGIITDLAIPVAANLGPGAIGVIAYAADEIGREPSTHHNYAGLAKNKE